MKKRILIITPFFIPAYSYGGIVRVTYEQAKGLVERGYDVTVVTTDVLDAKKRNKTLNEAIDGIKIIRFKNISNYLAKFQNLYLPLGMEKWFKNNISNYDIIHIHDIYNFCTFWAGKYALENNKKYFIQPHGTLSGVSIESRKSFLKNQILKKMKSIFDKANGFFALTKVEYGEIKNITDNKNVFELPNGIDVNKFNNIEKIDLHKIYNLNKETKIISFLGRIQYIKGLDISLKILFELDKIYKDWRFLIIGPDEGEKQKLLELSKELLIDDKIIWYGEENTNKKYELLKGSDVFLLSSRSEGFPVSVLEALACNIPVCVSKGCKLDINTSVGKVFYGENIIEGKECIYDILTNNKIYNDGIESYINKYDLQNIILQLINYYENN